VAVDIQIAGAGNTNASVHLLFVESNKYENGALRRLFGCFIITNFTQVPLVGRFIETEKGSIH
jgi:hypothetical protein